MKIAQKSPFTTLRANRANLFQFSCTILKSAGNLIIIGRKLKYCKKIEIQTLCLRAAALQRGLEKANL